ncbi:MAG: hypothetical protein LKM31_10645 [Sphingobium sp.]|jgi:hypothetical protein|nr:hypothetical protein [Sphingobium sp.]
MTAERWTRLDTEIKIAADELGVIDLRDERPGPDDPRLRRLMVGRLQHLETMGLAAEGDAGSMGGDRGRDSRSCASWARAATSSALSALAL